MNDLGRKEEALAEAQAALALDPLSLNANHNVARVHYFARRFDQTIEITQKTLEMDPNFAIGHLRLGRAYAAKANYGQAIEEFREFARLSRDVTVGNRIDR